MTLTTSFSKLGGRLRLIFSRNKQNAELPKYNLVQLFTKDGHTYYRFPKETALPLERFAMSMGLLERLSSGLSGSEMEAILTEIDFLLIDVEGYEYVILKSIMENKNILIKNIRYEFWHLTDEDKENLDSLLRYNGYEIYQDDNSYADKLAIKKI